MLAKTESMAVYGVSAYKVDVEVDVSSGLPSFCIVGLPDAACRESSKRVISALKNFGYQLPSRRITVNLAPAYLRKEGSIYDLAIATGILAAIGELDLSLLESKVFCGELSLDGGIRAIRGGLVLADNLRRQKEKLLIVPFKNYTEVSVIKGLNFVAPSTLNELLTYLVKGLLPQRLLSHFMPRKNADFREEDYSDIKGNANAKRALEIAAAGGHNVLLIGPPGVGKTMLAKRLPGILDELSEEESIETSKIYSVAGLLWEDKELIKKPPFRALHHCVSEAGMIGGGSNIKPGEISLAHNGVLFLDELPQFGRSILEALRQPLEEGVIRISRANMSVVYPARFMLVAAMNPCPCGFLTHPKRSCSCTPMQIQRYLSRISGPLLDRVDMHIELMPIKYEDIGRPTAAEPSSSIKKRVSQARLIQHRRYHRYGFSLNSQLPHKLLADTCAVSAEAADLLKQAMSEFFMSARAYDKILRVARTIADLDDKPSIGVEDISEAIGYRCLDAKIWCM